MQVEGKTELPEGCLAAALGVAGRPCAGAAVLGTASPAAGGPLQPKAPAADGALHQRCMLRHNATADAPSERRKRGVGLRVRGGGCGPIWAPTQ